MLLSAVPLSPSLSSQTTFSSLSPASSWSSFSPFLFGITLRIAVLQSLSFRKCSKISNTSHPRERSGQQPFVFVEAVRWELGVVASAPITRGGTCEINVMGRSQRRGVIPWLTVRTVRDSSLKFSWIGSRACAIPLSSAILCVKPLKRLWSTSPPMMYTCSHGRVQYTPHRCFWCFSWRCARILSLSSQPLVLSHSLTRSQTSTSPWTRQRFRGHFQTRSRGRQSRPLQMSRGMASPIPPRPICHRQPLRVAVCTTLACGHWFSAQK